jgi:hypothetical protein
MLAYVFWHRPHDGAAAAEYEARLRAFHEALAGAPPPGFHQSFTYRVSGAPWIPGGGPAYEDWYLLRDAAALDPLNQAAVSGSRHRPHDAVAARSQWGAAGLYLLRQGAPAFAGVGRALWLSKPAGQSYETFYAGVRGQHAESGAWALWGRQMVLGPTPEFCLHQAGRLSSTPPGGTVVGMEAIWAGSTNQTGK